MAERKTASALTRGGEHTPSKAALQRRMEETRESISQTVDEIKDTVSEQYETVKETVGEVLDWKEQFQKNPLVWGIGAVAVGLAVGYSMALLRQDDRRSSRRRRGSQAEDFTDTVFEGLATLGQSYILPAVTHKVKELFGVDITEELLGHARRGRTTQATARKNSGRKSAAKKSSSKKKAARKRTTKKNGAD